RPRRRRKLPPGPPKPSCERCFYEFHAALARERYRHFSGPALPPWRGSRSDCPRAAPTWPGSRLGLVIARYSRPAMARIWSDEGRLAAWLEVEVAALDAWAELGAVPAEAARAVRERARPPTPERVAELEAT